MKFWILNLTGSRGTADLAIWFFAFARPVHSLPPI